MVTAEERYTAVAVGLGVPMSAARGFGSGTLKVEGRIFAMLVQDTLVVKLPASRVDALIETGDGVRFDPGHGRLLKEWLSVPTDSSQDWVTLAREAQDYVASRR